MPELPEVETVCRQLEGLVAGRQLELAKIFDRKLKLPLHLLSDKRIQSVHRVGKLVMFDLRPSTEKRKTNGSVRNGKAGLSHLAVHLRMTGRLIWVGTKGRAPVSTDGYYYDVKKDEKHLRATFSLSGGELRFYDSRRFGTIEYFSSSAEIPILGADPMTDAFSVDVLASLVEGRKQPLKHWLLRQDAVCGIGNIYASEILFRARLSPFRAAGSLDKKELLRLHRVIRQVLSEAIDRNGTTFSDFQDSNGEGGGFGRFLRVYDREGLSCKRCRGKIERSTQSGRSTYYCAICQL